MEEGLDHLINLIEKSLNLDSQEKIKKIEEETKSLFKSLRKNFLVRLKKA